jgi:hypothetical protein
MDSRRKIATIASAASLVGLICWSIMFLAGTDAWHDVGRPDIWKLQGPPYADMRIFAFSFYAQFVVLMIGLIAPGLIALRRR